MPADITKHPIQGLKGVNRFSSMSDDEIAQLNKNLAIGKTSLPSTDMSEIKPYSLDTGMGSWGTSSYDAQMTFQPMTDDTLQDTRYENQSGLDVLANGVGKMLGTAATTFLSSLVGLPAGLITAASEGRLSGLWDNDVTNTLGEIDDWLEKNMTNYKSKAQEENKWWQNLDTMNFWADDVIKNAGFTLGAATSMAAGAGSLGLLSKSLGFVNNVSKGAKMAGAGISALFSATGEGMIEARNGVEERNKIEMQKLEDALAPEREAIELEKQMIDQEYQQTGDYETYRRNMTATLDKEKELNRRFQAGQQEIDESGKQMGNKILLGNQVLLTAGNLIQFGKAIYKSFDRSRHVAETASKLGKPFGVRAVKEGNQYAVKGKWLGRANAATKGILTEGSEEMNQQWIQNTAGLTEERKDANDYWKARLDPEAVKDTTEGMYTLGQAISKGFHDSWGDIDQWEQFVIGGLTGMAGTYMPTKLFNQDKTKSKWDPRRYGEWSGGAYNELQKFNKQYNQFSENVDDLNSVLSKGDFFERTKDLIAHTYQESKKAEALENNDKKAWKDADDKQVVHDIQSFYRAGKIDDLRAIYDEMSKNLSDEDVQNIIKSSTQETTDEDGKTKYMGAFVDENGNQTVSNDDIRKEVADNAEKMQERLDSYLDSIDYIQRRTNGQLTKEQEDNLAYLHNMGKRSIERSDEIIKEKRKQMPSRFYLKTNSTTEELAKQYASSDLAFQKNDDTPEGYVEVDTSLVNDTAFADFFVNNIVFSNNKEKQADKAEQADMNGKAIKDAITQNIKQQNPSATQEELNNETSQFYIDIADAIAKRADAMDYFNKVEEYMKNPQKVDEDKQKEEKKVEKEINTKQADSKFGGKTAKEIKQDINNGDTEFGDLDAFLKGRSDGTISASDATNEAVQEAKDMIDKQNSLEGFLSNGNNSTAVEDAKDMLQWLSDSANNADEITPEALDDFDATSLISDDEATYMIERGFDEARMIEEAEKRKQNAIEELSKAFESLNKDNDKRSIIPESVPEEGESGNFADLVDTGHDAVTKTPSNEGKNVPEPIVTPPESQDSPKTTTIAEAASAVNEATEQEENAPTVNGGTWRSTTRRFGREKGSNGKWHNTNMPYHETSRFTNDKESLEYKRSKAIYEFLNDPSIKAFDHVENTQGDKIHTGLMVRFRAKSLAQEIFDKDFGELTDEQKAQSIVIFMVDNKGNVLADLPYAPFEPSWKAGSPTEDVKMLDDMHKKISEALISRYQQDGTTDMLADGKEGLNLKFKNGKPYVGQIYEVMPGFVPTINGERNTLNEIAGQTSGRVNPFTLAVKVLGDQINTGYKKSINAKAPGKVGQCYIVIPDASGKHRAMPFITPLFNSQDMRDTQVYKLLDEALTVLEKYHDPKSNKEERNRAIDTICALLQIESPFLETDRSDKIVFRYNRLGDEKIKKAGGNPIRQSIQVAKEEGWKESLLSQLSGTPMQVSLRHINDKISVGSITANYNEVIGDVSFTNIPKNTRHTSGTWFTIRKISDEGVQKTLQTRYPEGRTFTETIEGKSYTISSGNTWTAVDPVTGETVHTLTVELALARMQAANKGVTEGNIVVDINGESRKYSVHNDTFVEAKIQRPKPVLKTATDSSAAATSKPKNTPTDDFMEALRGNWNPGTVEEAQASQRKEEEKESKTQQEQKEEPKSEPAKKFNTLEEAEKGAKALKIVNIRTSQVWNAIPQALRFDLMNGQELILSYNGVQKTVSINSVQELIKTMQEWNAAVKRNPDGFKAEEPNAPFRKMDRQRRKADIQKEKRWLQKNLPFFNTEERLNLIQGLIEIPGEENKAWGRFKQGVITLSDMAARGTLYHEAFHAVTQTLLSDDELDNLYENAAKRYKESDVALVEELLAEDFRRYVQRGETPIVGPILKFFRRIMNAIRNITNMNDPINQLFYRINNGEFKDTLPRQNRNGNAFYRTYGNKIQENLMRLKDSDAAKPIIDDFVDRNIIGNPVKTASQWREFKNYWREQGVRVNGGWAYDALNGQPGYRLKEIYITEGGVEWSAEDLFEAESMMHKEDYAAKQARRGVQLAQEWNRINRGSIQNLEGHQLSKNIWDNMSIREQEQWLKCHS